MKKRYLFSLLFFALCAIGCAANPSLVATDKTAPATESIESVTEKTSPKGNDTGDTAIETAYGITVTHLTKSASYYATDLPSACVLTAFAAYPKITVKDNTEASKLINDAILQELNTFLTFEKENAAYAEENRKIALENEGREPEPYTADFSYQLKRCDDKIISFVFHQYDFTGGAHGNHWSYGMTFDAATGLRIYLSGLSESTDSFLKMLLEELEKQAASPAYERYIDKNMAVDLEEAFLKNSVCWYLDRSGLSFISNPYVLGPYAAGTYEFNVPYHNLNGLKAKYAYPGNFIMKIFPGISAQYDLNNNGTIDEICYSVLSDENFENPHPVLTINGTDFSGEFEKLYMTGPLADSYYLIDVDPNDSYVEIAITDENAQNPERSCTHFFRYTAEKQLLYQGKTPGIFDPMTQVRYNSNGNLSLEDAGEAPQS